MTPLASAGNDWVTTVELHFCFREGEVVLGLKKR
jgi:hypothetical protein